MPIAWWMSFCHWEPRNMKMGMNNTAAAARAHHAIRPADGSRRVVNACTIQTASTPSPYPMAAKIPPINPCRI
jgi:hypothetical protein